jgi:hypothetical protein
MNQTHREKNNKKTPEVTLGVCACVPREESGGGRAKKINQKKINVKKDIVLPRCQHAW